MEKKCLIRFDDICPTMDFKNFELAFKTMDRFGIKPIIGVIPCNEDIEQIANDPLDNYWELLKELENKGYQIAMHGYNHVYDQICPRTMYFGKKHSEFAGHPYDVQLEKIKKGKMFLESHGIHSDIFFAPGHSFDKNTIKALRACGFKYMSDGFSSKPYKKYGVICVPCRNLGIPAKLRGMVTTAVSHPGEWSNPEKIGGIEELVYFCERNRHFIVSFDEIRNMKYGCYLIQRINEIIYITLKRMRDLIRRT